MDPIASVIVENILLPMAADLIRARLKDFAATISLDGEAQQQDIPTFPSAALIGLGQCGTNICLNVAELLSAVDDEAPPSESDWTRKVRASLPTLFKNEAERHLFAPVILLADLNVDNRETLVGARPGKKIIGYKRCHFIDLSWLQTGGAGNIPHKGQFLGRLALASTAKPDEQPLSDRSDWLKARSYFIDSLGIRENSSRLVFCTFSTGGGTGSGLSLEIGSAQQSIYKERLSRSKRAEGGSVGSEQHIEPVCAFGIGIMPRAKDDGMAQSINTGRCVCAYLARERAFDANISPRIFNALLLVSNDVMTWDGDDSDQVENRQVIERANEYVAQQMFHLLAAQALSRDYEERKRELVDLGVDARETIRLDASDLANALRGLTLVGYAESIPNEFDMADLLKRTLSFPRFNGKTQCLEGLSVSPQTRAAYAKLLETPNGELAKELGRTAVFRQTSTAVVILSFPDKYQIKEKDLRFLRSQVRDLVPRTKIKRYALVRGASRQIGLCVILGESACLSPEVRRHVTNYLLNCFRLDTVPKEQFGSLLRAAIDSQTKAAADEARDALALVMHEREDPGAILAGAEAGGMYAQLEDQLAARAAMIGLPGFGLGDVLLSRADALAALAYINERYRFAGPQDDGEPEDLA